MQPEWGLWLKTPFLRNGLPLQAENAPNTLLNRLRNGFYNDKIVGEMLLMTFPLTKPQYLWTRLNSGVHSRKIDSNLFHPSKDWKFFFLMDRRMPHCMQLWTCIRVFCGLKLLWWQREAILRARSFVGIWGVSVIFSTPSYITWHPITCSRCKESFVMSLPLHEFWQPRNIGLLLTLGRWVVKAVVIYLITDGLFYIFIAMM